MQGIFDSSNLLGGFSNDKPIKNQALKLEEESSSDSNSLKKSSNDISKESPSQESSNSASSQDVDVTTIEYPDFSQPFGQTNKKSQVETPSSFVIDKKITNKEYVAKLTKNYNLNDTEMKTLCGKYEKNIEALSLFLSEQNDKEFVQSAVEEKNDREFSALIQKISDNVSSSIIRDLKSYSKNSFTSYNARKKTKVYAVALDVAESLRSHREGNINFKKESSFDEVSNLSLEINEINPSFINSLVKDVYYSNQSFFEFLKMIQSFTSKDEVLDKCLSQIIEKKRVVENDNIDFHANKLFLV